MMPRRVRNDGAAAIAGRRAARRAVWRGGPPAPMAAYVALVGAAIVALLPIYWMVLTALRPEGDILGRGLNLLPEGLTGENFIRLFSQTLAGVWLRNSLIVAFAATALALVLSTLAGYALAKYDFRGKRVAFGVILLTATVPQFVTIIPVFDLIRQLGLINSYASLVLPFAVNPFAVFLARQYLASIPNELLDAARVDGASEIRVFWTVVLPLSKPLVGAVGVLVFDMVWGQLLWPLVMTQSADMFTFPVGLAGLNAYYDTPYGLMSAASVVFTLPLMAVFLLMQRQMIAGLTGGSLKE